MDDDILQSLDTYKSQLAEIELAIVSTDDKSQIIELESLKSNIKQLIELTEETLNRSTSTHSYSNKSNIENEFALFMAEMEMEGAVNTPSTKQGVSEDVKKELKELEGMKCRAPHKHIWGDVMYHNAMVCSVLFHDKEHSFEEIKVKIMFINPTHQEMLPCPYLMEGNCKFEDEQCKYSHGEVVSFSALKEYNEPNFEMLATGNLVLAQQSNKLWSRAKLRKIVGDSCVVQFESNKKDLQLKLHEILPLDSEGEDDNSDDDYNSDQDDIINTSLLNTPGSQALGDWEKYTKGMGSKLMQKMGYIVGTGLGRFSNGIIDPVTAVVLPPGKSLDHCMDLREKAGGDKDLFSVEKKLKRLQKKQEKKNIKNYEREKNQINVFNFLNETLAGKSAQPTPSISKSKHRQEIKTETSRSLNVASLKIDEDMKRIERDLQKLKESLSRHSDSQSQVHKSLKLKFNAKQRELQTLKMKAVNIASEQNLRSDKKKLTIF